MVVRGGSLLSVGDKRNESILFGDYNMNWTNKRGKSDMEKFKYKQLIDKATIICIFS